MTVYPLCLELPCILPHVPIAPENGALIDTIMSYWKGTMYLLESANMAHESWNRLVQ